MVIWIKDPAVAWTGNKNRATRGVLVSEGKILELVDEFPNTEFDEIYDASNLVLIPGLINCHHHFYQTLTRALPAALNKELFPWLASLYPVWSNLTEDSVRASTRAAVCELLLSGCTTTVDHHYVFSKALDRAIDVQAEEVKSLGIRAVLTRGSMSLSKDNGGLPPSDVVQTEDVILKESQRLIDQWHDPSEGAMLQIALAPCSPFSVTDELMSASAQLARENKVLLHTHLAETSDENSFCENLYGCRPLDYLEKVGWLSSNVWLAHGIHFLPQEIQRIGRTKIGICHCPSSNMLLASGFCPVEELRLAGAPVGLGVDGSSSNDSSNLMQELRQAYLLQRLRLGADQFSHIDALELATKEGARLLNRDDIGEIREGARADLALFSTDELRFAGAHDPLATLVLSGAHRAEAVMVNGEWRVKDGELLGVDLKDILSHQKKAALALV